MNIQWKLRLTLLALVIISQLTVGGSEVSAQTEGLNPAVKCQEVRLPVSLQEGQPGNYEVVGKLCFKGNGKKVAHLLLHGATYSNAYWDFPLLPQFYSYVRSLTNAGYATLNIDRIGIGASSRPPADQVTIQANAFVVHQLVQALRDGRIGSFSKVILVGHSLGSGIALSAQAQYGDANGLILTGFLHAMGPGFAEIPNMIYPAQLDPRFASQNLPDGYFTTIPGTRPGFYYTPVADPNVIDRDEQTKETITLGEINTFPPLVLSPVDAQSIHVPVLYVIGNRDNVFCTPPQCSEAQIESSYYPGDAHVEVRVLPGTGHSLNLHFTAPAFFAIAREWSDRYFGN
ncbi:MAG TPA: alpha/beta hydrolase [Blastocatellia bacterium]|nr:alpha/beta hydrolase [Blastocatellia bacterium]